MPFEDGDKCCQETPMQTLYTEAPQEENRAISPNPGLANFQSMCFVQFLNTAASLKYAGMFNNCL